MERFSGGPLATVVRRLAYGPALNRGESRDCQQFIALWLLGAPLGRRTQCHTLEKIELTRMYLDIRTCIRQVAVLAALALVVSSQALAEDPPPAPAAPDATAAAQQNKFDINEFRVLGNTVLPQRDVESAVYPFLGPGRDIQTVQKAADALTKAYKDAGFGTVFVDIPEQTVDDGIVRLKVTEGRLDRVRVRGARYFSGRQILESLPALEAGQTPHLTSLQDELTALNARTPDRSITPVLKAGTEPGTVDVDLAVKDTLPFHGYVQVDDRHTADTTPNRVTASVSYDNLWQRQDSISLEYQTAPANTANDEIESATYLAHIGDGVAAFSYLHTNSNVVALGTLGVLGKGRIYGAHWLQPITNTAESSQSLTIGVDYKDVQTLVFPDATNGSSSAPVTAPVHYLNWTAGYSQVWRAPTHTFGVTGSIGFGIRGLIDTTTEFENARYLGNPGYFYLRFSGDALQTLPAGMALQAKMTSQWSMDPLVNNEQFSLGGQDTVRGYLEAEALTDTGVAGTLELHSPQLGAHLGSMLRPLYAFGFVDVGVGTLLDPLASQESKFHLWSTGVGLRLENSSGLSGSIDYAIPEKDGTRTRKHDGRVDFLLRYGF
jgi:hemolysin activation/secretion protein